MCLNLHFDNELTWSNFLVALGFESLWQAICLKIHHFSKMLESAFASYEDGVTEISLTGYPATTR